MSESEEIPFEEVLDRVLDSKKNVKIFTKYIEKTSDPKRVLYNTFGLLKKNRDDYKEVLNDIKQGKVCWNSTLFDTVRSRIQEHDEYLLNPVSVVEGVVQCNKCGSWKTWSVQKQIRSSDEGFSTLSTCVMCGSKWRIN